MRPTHKRRWLRWLGIGLLGVLGLVALVVIGGLAYLESKAGRERLRHLILEEANQSIQGSLSLRAAELRGTRLILRGVELREPDGARVAEVERVELTVLLWQLVHRRIEVSQARVDTPHLFLEQDERGLNLSRALASRTVPRKQEKQGGPSIAVDALVLRHGSIDFRQSDGKAGRTVRLEELDGEGRLRVDGGGQRLEADLALGARLTEPVKAPLALRLSASGQGDHRVADVALTVAGSRLDATAALDGNTRAHVRLTRLELEPDTVRAFLPDYLLLTPITLKGGLDRDDDSVVVHLDAAAGSATAVVDGAFDLGRRRAREVTIALRRVDLSELIAQGPKSNIRLELAAEGGGTGLDDLDGKVWLKVPPSTMDGQPFGPVRLQASAANGNVELRELFARLPGVSLQASGHGTRQRMDLQGRMDARDLAAFGRTLGKLAGSRGLPVSGAGRLTFLVQGPTHHPGVTIHGAFPSVRYQDKEGRGLAVDARVPNVRSPRNAHVAVGARALALGARRFNRVSLGLSSAGRRVRADASVHGDADLALHLAATLDADDRGLRLSALELGYPAARWRLAAPAHIAFREGELSAQPLTLRSGRQALSLAGWKKGHRLRASVAIDSLELERLPKAFVDPKLNLGGRLNARVRARGSTARPELQAKVELRGGRFKRYSNLRPMNVDLDLSAAEAGLRASVSARRGGQSLVDARARVDAPPSWLRDPRRLARAPLLLEANVGPVALAELQALARRDTIPGPVPERLEGLLRAQLTARGSLAAPRVSVRSSVEGLGTKQTPVGTVTLDYDYADARHALDALMRSANGGTLRLAARARLDVSYPAVTSKPDLASVPLSAELTSSNFDLSFLSGLTPTLRTIAGRLQVSARANGTLGAPKVAGEVEWVQGRLELLGLGAYHDIHLALSGDERRIELRELTAKSDQGTARLTGLAQRTDDRFTLHATADASRFPLVWQDQLVATLSLRATADGGASGERIYIRDLNIPEAHVELPDVRRKDLQELPEPKDIVLVRNGVPIEKPKPKRDGRGLGGSGQPPRREITLRINAPRNLWVRGEDVNIEVGLSDDFRVELNRTTSLFGEVRILRGRLDAFGRHFDVQSNPEQPSLVRFTGPPMTPEVDATAVYRNEPEQITVTLHVIGQGKSIQLEPSSEPPLSESEIYTLLATGHPTLKHGGEAVSPGGEAASLLGSLAARELKKTISSKLPLDVFSIEAGDQGLQGTRLEAGTYIRDKLYVGFVGRIGANPMRGENSNAVHAEYQLNKRWLLEGEYGDARSGYADLLWSKEY